MCSREAGWVARDAAEFATYERAPVRANDAVIVALAVPRLEEARTERSRTVRFSSNLLHRSKFGMVARSAGAARRRRVPPM